MFKVYDLIVLGGGPAGLEAGIYAAQAGLQTAIIEAGSPSEQAAGLEDMGEYHNWQMCDWEHVVSLSLLDQALASGCELMIDSLLELRVDESPKKIVGPKSSYLARSIILAPAAFPGMASPIERLLQKFAFDEYGYIINHDNRDRNIEGVFVTGGFAKKPAGKRKKVAVDGAVAAAAAEKYLRETEQWFCEVLKSEKPVLIAYYNPTDRNENEKMDVVENFVAQYKHKLALVKVDAASNELLKRRYQLATKTLPMVQIFTNGEAVNSISEINEEQLKKLSGFI